MAKRELVGHIGVDAGLCWIGDPCYVIAKDCSNVFNSWKEFCEQIEGDYPTMKSFNYAAGHEGLGVCVSTGYGDGTYPVYITRNREGRIASVTVKFD